MSKLVNRQYVGARYVPKLLGEWDKNISYENLVVVTNKGNSYTSKQPVPVGTEITNTDYWLNTGNYNAQVEEYRQQTEDVSSQIEYLANWLPSNRVIERTTLYVDHHNGSNTNDGLTKNTAVYDLGEAIIKGLRKSNSLVIHLLDDYNGHEMIGISLSGVELHIIGNENKPTIIFPSDIGYAIYGCHLNIQNCTLTTTGVNSFYSDNNLVILKNDILKCDYIQNGGSLDISNCEISSIKGNYCFVRMTEITLNSLTRSERNASVTLDGCSLRTYGTITTNYTDTAPDYVYNCTGSALNINNVLSKTDGTKMPNLKSLLLNNSTATMTYERFNTTYRNFEVTNGGKIQTDYCDITQDKFSKTYNSLCLPCVCPSTKGVIRCSLFNENFYPQISGSGKATINTGHVYINGNHYSISEATPVTLQPHASNTVFELTVDPEIAVNASGVIYISMTVEFDIAS